MTTITKAGCVPHPALISGRHYKKKSPVTKSARDRGISLDGWLFVASSPDMHFFSFFDQFITELRMRDGDQRFRTLPCRETL